MRKQTGATPPEPLAPSPVRRPPPRTPPAPPGDSEWHESYEIEGMLSRCAYIHSPHLNTQSFSHNAYAKDSKSDFDFIADLLSTLSTAWKYRWHWFWRRQ
jgi:hypothetical protein